MEAFVADRVYRRSMATTSPYPHPGVGGPLRVGARADAAARRLLDVVRAVAEAAFLASSTDALDEAGVLRTAVAQRRRADRHEAGCPARACDRTAGPR